MYNIKKKYITIFVLENIFSIEQQNFNDALKLLYRCVELQKNIIQSLLNVFQAEQDIEF